MRLVSTTGRMERERNPLTNVVTFIRLCDSFDWWLTEARDQDVTWAELFDQQEKPR